MTLVLALPLAAQVAPSPRRLSRSFPGELPWAWQIEGSGSLRRARAQVLDESGKARTPWAEMPATSLGAGLWQVWSMIRPQTYFQGLPEGRYTLAWELSWDRGGITSVERDEASFQLESPFDGWLQRGYANDPEDLGQFRTGGGEWPIGGHLALELAATPPLKRIRYQVVLDQSESVVRPWTDLDLSKGSSWQLLGDPSWPQGAAHLWVFEEALDGRVRAHSQDIFLGRLARTAAPVQGTSSISKAPLRSSATPPRPLAQSLPVPPTWSAPLSLLSGLDTDAPVAWSETNRTATVSVGYRDEERNEQRLWPTDYGRPMSLSISGANGLGKPLYTVSYLMADTSMGSSTSAGQPIEGLAAQALSVGSGSPSLPAGATTLQIGGETAPVVFSPGVVEDYFGNPLAKGFAWAAFTGGDGTTAFSVTSAHDWAASPASAPATGLSSISKAALLRWNLIQDSITATGYDRTDAQMDDNRSPYLLSVEAQDASGRVLAVKPLGGKKATAELPVVAVGGTPRNAAFWTSNFSNTSAALPSWLQLGGPSSVVITNSVGQVQMGPSLTYTATDPNCPHLPGITCDSITVQKDPGSLSLMVGPVANGSSLQVSFTTSGPVSAYWHVDGDSVPWVLAGQYSGSNVSSTLTITGATVQSLLQVAPPAKVVLVLQNSAPAQPSTTTSPTYAYVSSASVSGVDGPIAVQVQDATVGASAPLAAGGRVPGYAHTQYGSVSIPNQGLCQATLTTDPDGASVAEIKDPEGRTIYKIVNPSTAYTNLIHDFRGNALLASPTIRNTAIPTTDQTSQPAQIDLVTEYGFDSEGHLRILLPPLGFKNLVKNKPVPADPLWGARLDESLANPVLSLTDPNNSKTCQLNLSSSQFLPYATYNAYDSSGHLIATYNPDEGMTRFVVDQRGKVHFSQSESQRTQPNANGAAAPRWTRTIYDSAYRTAAIGEVADASVVLEPGPTANIPAAIAALLPSDSNSINVYDAYVDGSGTAWDPVTDTDPDLAPVQPYLPKEIIWQAFPDGQLTQTSDNRSVERYCYDQDGRIVIRWVRIRTSADGAATPIWRSFAIGVFYDFAGRVKRLVYPTGPGKVPLQVVYTYDELGRLFSVGTPADKAYFAHYVYQPTGEVRSIVYGPGQGFLAKRVLTDPQGWMRSLTVQGNQ